MINYFGTNLRSAGHYFWKLSGEDFSWDSSLYFPSEGKGIPLSRQKEWPFNPEELPISRNNGDVEYHQINGYSIIAICGSCKDKRNGCKSVFFLYGNFTKYEMIEKMKAIPVVDKIIKQMPFEVKWTQLLNKESTGTRE